MVASYQGKLTEPKKANYPKTRNFMSRSFITISEDTDIYQAMALLLKHKVSGAPVVDKYGKLAGIVSEKDCLNLLAHDTYENTLPGGPVSHFMTKDVLTLSPESGLDEVANLFMRTPYKKLPVLDHDKLVGIVRRRDVLEVVLAHHKKRLVYMKQTESVLH